MASQQSITRLLANVILFLKRKELSAARPRFLVFTGTSGKTTNRSAVFFALTKIGEPVRSLPVGYTNELGIILTCLNLKDFHPLRFFSWKKIFAADIPPNIFVCIENTADIYKDVDWFLKHFGPFAVFCSGICSEEWARPYLDIQRERKALIEAVPQEGYVITDDDDKGTKELLKTSKIEASGVLLSSRTEIRDPSRLAFDPQQKAIAMTRSFIEKIFPKETLGQNFFDDCIFPSDRLLTCTAINSAQIIADTYKATPLDTLWFLGMIENQPAQKKIVIFTEMRPLLLHKTEWLERVAAHLRFATTVYFLGPKEQTDFFRKSLPNIHHSDKNSFEKIAKEILDQTSQADLIAIKGSFRYELEKLVKHLCYSDSV